MLNTIKDFFLRSGFKHSKHFCEFYWPCAHLNASTSIAYKYFAQAQRRSATENAHKNKTTDFITLLTSSFLPCAMMWLAGLATPWELIPEEHWTKENPRPVAGKRQQNNTLKSVDNYCSYSLTMIRP